MKHEVLPGRERRRRWSDEEKLTILAEVGRNGWTVADVARRHDLTRQHIYQWRRELRRKFLYPQTDETIFLPVEMADSAEVKDPVFGPGGSEVTVILRNGRQIRCRDGIGQDALARLIRLVETA